IPHRPIIITIFRQHRVPASITSSLQRCTPIAGSDLLVHPFSCFTHSLLFDIWDTAGQERNHSLAPIYYCGVAAIIVIYDISSISQDTFVKAKKWVEELQVHGSHKLVMALVANKLDLEPNREVEVEEGEQFAHESEMFYIETSTKTEKYYVSLARDTFFKTTFESLIHYALTACSTHKSSIEILLCQ
ncbi:hypothetical protein S83_054469, partial [Arachis hypogaea]